MGVATAVINAESKANLKEKTEWALKDILRVNPDDQFSLSIGEFDGDDESSITVQYIDDGEWITDSDYSLLRIMSY
jgi:hypothetical protein